MNVSVALATYNGARYLQEQLDSISRQTRPPFEVVASDDGSTDRTVAMLRHFAEGAPFAVRVHVNERSLGAEENFMRAVRVCRGELVAFSDQDDVWRPAKLERCVEPFADPDVQLVVHGWTVVDESLHELDHVSPDRARGKWGQAPGMAMVFRRSLLDLLAWEDRPPSHEQGRRLLHDEWVYGLARVSGRVVLVDESLCLYRQHGANVEGAPDRGLGERGRLALSLGPGYYARRADQAHAWAGLLAEVDPAESAGYARLESAARARSRVYDGDGLRGLMHAMRAGAYRSRRNDGFGLRGFARDAFNVVRKGA